MSNVFGQLKMRSTRPLFLRFAKCFAYARGHQIAAFDLSGELGQRLHHADDVDDLEPSLLAGFHRLLSGYHDHGHGAKIRICGRRYQIRCAGSECRKAYARLARQSTEGCCHETGGLFMPRKNQLDRASRQRIEKIQIFFSRNPEYVFHPFSLKCFYK